MRILLIEDDQGIAETVAQALSTYFVVDNAYTGAEAMDYFGLNTYDLIILDYTLPDIQGMSLYQELRSRDRFAPVLVLTGNYRLDDKVRLLDAGVDDYVTKPFHMDELLARVRVLLRRGPVSQPSNTLTFEDLLLDVGSRTVRRGVTDIRLRRKEFDLLEYLLRNQGRVVTRDMITNHVWESPGLGTTNVVDVHIKNLRDRIDKPFDRPLIQTVPGVGYKLDT